MTRRLGVAARRMAGIEPFHVMEVMAAAQALEAQGRDIVHMEVGEPDFPTAQPILEAAQRFIATGHVHYTHALGLPQLREAIARYYQRRYRVDVEPERIVITAGASGALLLALGALVDPGDEVLLTDPGYPCNRNFVHVFEGITRTIPVDASTGYQPTAEHVEHHWSRQSRALLVATPSNPTGTTIEARQLAAIRATLSRLGGTLLVDEIYHGLTYGFDADTALTLGDDIFVINSFSKYFGMTGWRLGWLVVPKAHLRDVEKLAQNLFIAPSTPAQFAALAAFDENTLEILETRREAFKARRDLLLPGLRDLGFVVATEPRGAFYIYADSRRHADDSFELAKRLIVDGGVAATPGLDFGTAQPRQHMRFAYTTGMDRIEAGLDRMAKMLRQ